jgi:hypothetical protein
MADGDAFIIEIQKWGLVLFMFLAIMFALIKTRRKVSNTINEHKGRCYVFAIVCWVVVTVSSFIRDSMSDEEEGEGFVAFIPNFLLTILWYGFVASALTWKLSGEQMSDIKSPLSLRSRNTAMEPSARVQNNLMGGMKRRKGGSAQPATTIGLTITEVQQAAVYLVAMGIIMTIVNVIGTLYIYYKCKDSDCEDDKIVNSLVGAQYNIIIIGLVAVSFIYFTKNSRKPSS